MMKRFMIWCQKFKVNVIVDYVVTVLKNQQQVSMYDKIVIKQEVCQVTLFDLLNTFSLLLSIIALVSQVDMK